MRIAHLMVAVLFCSPLCVFASPTKLPVNDSILGVWKITAPGGSCSEVYNFKADGKLLFSSGEEEGESNYQIDATPSPNGFYKFTNKVVKDNGKQDCSGRVGAVGVNSIVFAHFLPVNDQMVMCYKETLDSCFGPLIRQ